MVDSSDFVEVTENINNQFHWMMLNIIDNVAPHLIELEIFEGK